MEQKVVSAGNVNLTQSYSYDTIDGTTGTLVSQYNTSYTGSSASWNLQFNYTYDDNGNITGITRTDQSASTSSTYSYTYTYDQAGQLTSATDTEAGLHYEYEYDQHGNIMSKSCYLLNADGSTSLIETKIMGWFTPYQRVRNTTTGTTDTYQMDDMGNLIRVTTSEGSYSLSWGEGRMLTQIYKSATNKIDYTYNADGLRTKKVVKEGSSTTTTEYMWGSNGLAGYKRGNTTVIVLYDSEGSPVGFSVDGEVFTYVKNLQGDVIRVLDVDGNTMVSYTYDPWGVPTITGIAQIAALNPCSYRGYDYDEETGYYYLQSRYYDPEIGRFINADDTVYLGVGESIVSFHLFSYCHNSPVGYSDASGHVAVRVLITAAIGGVVAAVLEIVLQMLQVKKFENVSWSSVAIEFFNGALTGALIGMGLSPGYTNLGRTLINMVTSIAHSIRKKANFWSTIGSAILSGLGTYAVGRFSQAKAVITKSLMDSIVKTLKTRFSRFTIRFLGMAITIVI